MNETSAKGQGQNSPDCTENADALQRIARRMKVLHSSTGAEATPARFKNLLKALDDAERNQGGGEPPTRRP